jgi:hypothetical protein
MAIVDSGLPPYPVYEVLARPWPERIRLISRMWAAQVVATPFAVVVMYWVKYGLLFAGGWAFSASGLPSEAGFSPD